MSLDPRKLNSMWTPLKKNGYWKSTLAKAALFRRVTPTLLMVHNINHMLSYGICVKEENVDMDME